MAQASNSSHCEGAAASAPKSGSLRWLQRGHNVAPPRGGQKKIRNTGQLSTRAVQLATAPLPHDHNRTRSSNTAMRIQAPSRRIYRPLPWREDPTPAAATAAEATPEDVALQRSSLVSRCPSDIVDGRPVSVETTHGEAIGSAPAEDFPFRSAAATQFDEFRSKSCRLNPDSESSCKAT